MRKFRSICIFGLLTALLFACRKNEDNASPRISVSEPVQGTVYNVYDTLRIHASISDESGLVSVKISLLDAEQKPVLKTIDFKPDTSSFDVSASLPLDDILLADGIYTLQIKAFDGTNYSNSFTNIQINAVPLELKYPVLITQNGIYGTSISIADANTGWRKVLSLEGDYHASAVSSYEQLVFTAGGISGNLNASLMPAGTVLWQVPLLSAPPYRYFEDVLFDKSFLYVAFYKGKILGYDRSGMIVYSAVTESAYFPEKLGTTGDFILAGLRQKTGNTRKIGVYYAVSGSLVQSLEVPLDVIAFKSVDYDNVLVFGNNGNTGTIMEYTVSLNKLRQLHIFTDGKIASVAQMNSDNYFISGQSAVYRFIYPTNTLVKYISDAPKAFLDFDMVNDRLYALYDHRLSIFAIPVATPVGSILVADSALAFHLMYNK